MTINKNDTVTYTLDTSPTVDLSDSVDLFFDNSQKNTMYYTSTTGTIDTITFNSTATPNYTTIDTSSWISTPYHDYFKNIKEFEHVMPDLTKVKEMCSMYPAMDKAFENFKAIYDLIKDDYEARKNNDS